MTLSDLLAQLDTLDDELTIYAEKNPDWSINSLAIALPEPEEGGVPDEAQGMSYLLEVLLAKEVVDDWSGGRGGRQPTVKENATRLSTMPSVMRIFQIRRAFKMALEKIGRQPRGATCSN